MKKLLSLSMMALLVLGVMPAVMATSIGSTVSVGITTEQFEPRVWMCDNRIVYDDNTEPGRLFQTNGVPSCPQGYSGSIDKDGQQDCYLMERINNYAFEGEQIAWDVLVMDKNKIDQNIDVYATVGPAAGGQGPGNSIEVNCVRKDHQPHEVPDSCNARIEQEYIEWNDDTMAMFECLLTVETPTSMYGEHWITVEAMDGDGLKGIMDENEYWFLNPIIALDVTGVLTFNDVRPGTDAYSETLLIENDADVGSGVMLDMFISGTDFYDSYSSGARCPTTNQLALKYFRYHATNGAYSTADDLEIGRAGNGGGDAFTVASRDVDAEGYVDIGYGIGFNDPSPFYNGYEILQAQPQSPYYAANVLAPGAEMALTFKLSMPEPCTGDFNSGQFYFWGEAI